MTKPTTTVADVLIYVLAGIVLAPVMITIVGDLLNLVDALCDVWGLHR